MTVALAVAVGGNAEQPFDGTIAMFRFLEGRWEGSGTFPGVGPIRDAYTFRELFGHFLAVDYEVRDAKDKVVWRDFWIAFRDPESKNLQTVNFGQDGSIANSTLVQNDGNTWRFVGVTRGSAEYRAYEYEITKLSPASVELKTFVERDKKRHLLYGSTYRKAGGR